MFALHFVANGYEKVQSSKAFCPVCKINWKRKNFQVLVISFRDKITFTNGRTINNECIMNL